MREIKSTAELTLIQRNYVQYLGLTQALRLSMLGWSLNAPLLGTSGGGYGEVGARDPSAKTRDRMIEYVGEAMDD